MCAQIGAAALICVQIAMVESVWSRTVGAAGREFELSWPDVRAGLRALVQGVF